MPAFLIITSIIALGLSVWGQSTFSSSNQDTYSQSKGNSQGFTGHINSDMEDRDIDFSGSMDNGRTVPNDYREIYVPKEEEEDRNLLDPP